MLISIFYLINCQIPGTSETRIAYEVSVGSLEVIEEKDETKIEENQEAV